MRIGFIGLGNMGGSMAQNLLKAQHSVAGFDISAEAQARLAAAGARGGHTIAEAAAGADAVITMLPAGPEVRAVYLGPDGILAAAAPGALLIDCSTIDVATARLVAAEAAKRGFDMLDAPVSGGTAGAAAGTLTFMVGGSEAGFARAQAVLQGMGRTIIHAGASGAGQTAKICNNLMLAVSMIGVSEAFALAERLGLERQKLFDITSKSTGQCWALTSYCPAPGPVPAAPSNRGYAPGFTVAMMLKDLLLEQQAAASAGSASPLGAAAAQLYQLATNSGLAARDFSAIFPFLTGEAQSLFTRS
jgi:3-hydroxyisobutyrate dehydrogenase